MITGNVPEKVPTETVSLVVNKIASPMVRSYLYLVVFLSGVVLAVFGKITAGQLSDWLLFVGTILGVGSSGLAIANRPVGIQSRPDFIHPDAISESNEEVNNG